MTQRAALCVCAALVLGCAALVARADGTAAVATGPADEVALEALRARGDLPAQRRHLWRVLGEVARPSPADGRAGFLHWYGAGETFASGPVVATGSVAGAFGQSEAALRVAAASALPPLIVRTHYNEPSYRHLRAHGLYRREALALRRADGPPAAPIPAFPRAAIVAKSAWWPVPRGGAAALPVWDDGGNRPRAAGNDYPGWRRRIAVCDSTDDPAPRAFADVELLGVALRHAPCVPVTRFQRVVLDDALVAALAADPAARKLAAMVMARPLAAGDSLLLVALHVATREIADWVWGTFWWHDGADDAAAAAATRAAALAPVWRNYRSAVAFDAERPRAPDGGPLVAYNPWFEARFPDSGQGAGVASNCMSCHQRAAFPARDAFSVTRGRQAVPLADDGRPPLETHSLWSIPLEAR